MLAVRMRDGLALGELPPERAAVAPQLAGWGLVERPALEQGRLVLTQRGRLLADAVVRELLG
jgi:hypothetical protein